MVDVARGSAGSSSLEETLRGLKPEVSPCDGCSGHGGGVHELLAVSNNRSTVQEISKFETKFKDPKFMELFADYARDLADPAVSMHISMMRPSH